MKRKITLSILSFILVLLSFEQGKAQTCYGSPTPGTLTTSNGVACPSSTFTLTLCGHSYDAVNIPSSVSYVIQDSVYVAPPGTGGWVTAPGTSSGLLPNLNCVTYTGGPLTQTTYYRVAVICSTIADTIYSNTIVEAYMTSCLVSSCTTSQYSYTPLSDYDAGYYSLNISDPQCGTSINYGPNTSYANNTSGYTNWGYTGLEFTPGETGSVTASVYGGFGTKSVVAVWIDYANSGSFTPVATDLVGGGTINASTSYPAVITGSFPITIPATITNYGYHVMRVKQVPSAYQTESLTTVEADPCTTFEVGETFDYLVLIVPPGATVSASPNPICSGGTMQLSSSYTGTTAATYSWSGPGSFTSTVQNPIIANISPTASGTYSAQVIVNGAISCNNTASVVETVVTTPVVSLNPASSATTCPGVCQLITASGGTYKYQWYNGSGAITGATSQTYCTATAGSYYITETVPSTTCTGTSSATAISLYSSPVITSFTTTNNNFCYGNCTTLSVTGTPQTVATITPTSGTQIIALINASGTYSTNVCPATTTTYSISNITNLTTSCSAVASNSVTITVNPLPVTPTVTATSSAICIGTCTLLTITGTPNTNVSYTAGGVAQPTASLSATGVYTLTVCPTLTTTYSVTSVTNPVTTCSITTTGAATTITVNPLPTASLASNTSQICAGGCSTYTITGTPNTSVAYTYTGLGSNVNVTLSAAGTNVFTVCPTADPTIVQLVSVTNPTTTCTQSLTGTVSTIVNPLPSVTGFSLLGNNPICLNACSGSALSFTATPSAIITYSVSPGTTHTVTVTAGGTATVSVCPTATTTYSLVSIKNPTTTCTVTISGSIVMTVNPLPTSTMNVSNATICNGTCTNLTFSSTTSNLVVNYLWTPPGTASGSATLSATGTGTVTVCPTVTSTYSFVSVVNPATSCSAVPTGSVTVTVNQLPTASFSANTASVCTGTCGTLTFTATPNSTIIYSVSTSGTTSATASAAGTVAVTVCPTVATTYSLVSVRLPATGCSVTVTGSVTITVNPLPTPVITPQGSTTICQGGLVVLNSSTGLNYHYQWYGDGVAIAGATNSTYSTGIAGTYTVADTNAVGCTATSSSVVVTVVNVSASITASGATSFCDNPGAHVTLTANTGNLYQWMENGSIITGATSNTYAATTSGSYQVVVTNNPNCSATSSEVDVTVYPLPVATVDTSGPTAFCPGGSVTLEADTATGYSYQWYSSTGLISGAVSANYVAAVTGTYYVVVTSSHSCVSTSPTVAVTVYQQPTATITYTGDTLLCYNGNLTLTGNTNIAGSGYAWYFDGSSTPIPGAVNATYDAFVAGTYTVLITSPNGCTTMSAPVKIYMLPSPVITAINPTTFCWGGASELVVGIGNLNTTDVTYQWTDNGILIPGANSNSIGAAAAGTYQCIITIPAANCSSSSSTIYIRVNPLPDPVVSIYDDSVVTQNYFVSYEWFVNNSQIQGATGNHVIATELGLYKVAVTDTNGCTAESEAQIVTTLSSPSLNVTSVTGIDVKVYPNPANAVVNIEAPVNVDITLSSIDGKILLHKTNAKEIDLSPYADGLYMLAIYDKNGERIKLEKLVKNSN